MALRSKKTIVRRKADWLTTYSDMVTLLMVFFIILLSFGDVKEVRTQIILSAFSGQLGLQSGGRSLESSEEFETLGQSIEALPSSQDETSLERSTNRAAAILNPYVRSKYIRVIEDERGLVISLFTDVFFAPGEAEVDADAIGDILQNIRLLMDSREFGGNILVEGHTDNVPYVGTEYRDSFALSSARAWEVMNAIREVPSIYPLNDKRISVHGYGANRPVEENTTPEGRAYNRRVDIILENN
ncbi:motility protein B [Spirochaetota bacterium]|nr:motility protein B [Spirochaetota bacterium]